MERTCSSPSRGYLVYTPHRCLGRFHTARQFVSAAVYSRVVVVVVVGVVVLFPPNVFRILRKTAAIFFDKDFNDGVSGISRPHGVIYGRERLGRNRTNYGRIAGNILPVSFYAGVGKYDVRFVLIAIT